MSAEVLTTAELAKRWGMSIGALENWRARKKGPRFFRLGKPDGQGRIRYRMTDVLEYERRGTIKTTR